MADKEATARIKINKLLEAAGWRFFAEGSAPANIRLEPSVTIKASDLDAKGFPLIVLEAKAEDKNPLGTAKEQARNYAKSKDELLEEEFAKFVADFKPRDQDFFQGLHHSRFKAVPSKYRALISNYIKDYVSLNRFAP